MFLRNPEISDLMNSLDDGRKEAMKEDLTRLVHDLVIEQEHPLSFQALIAVAYKAP